MVEICHLRAFIGFERKIDVVKRSWNGRGDEL